MKKAHPCGSHEWELLRVGQDLKMKCRGCGHLIMAPRRQIEKNIRKILPPEASAAAGTVTGD